MSTIAEIEAAIEKLPVSQLDELVNWIHTLRTRRATPADIDRWLEQARGAAIPGVTTAEVMALTRDDA